MRTTDRKQADHKATDRQLTQIFLQKQLRPINSITKQMQTMITFDWSKV